MRENDIFCSRTERKNSSFHEPPLLGRNNRPYYESAKRNRNRHFSEIVQQFYLYRRKRHKKVVKERNAMQTAIFCSPGKFLAIFYDFLMDFAS